MASYQCKRCGIIGTRYNAGEYCKRLSYEVQPPRHEWDLVDEKPQAHCIRCGVYKQSQPHDNYLYGCSNQSLHMFSDGTTSKGGRWYTGPKEYESQNVTVFIAGHKIDAGDMVAIKPAASPVLYSPRPKIYVAAPYSEAKRVRSVHKMIKEVGGVPTSIWAEQATSSNECTDPHVIERAISENDLGVEAADLLLGLGFEGKGRAMFGEIRYAIHLGIPVLYHGPGYLDVRRKGATIYNTRGLAITRTIEAVKNAVARSTEHVYSAPHASEHSQRPNS